MRAKVEAETNAWLAKHPLRDDDIGTHAEEVHEEFEMHLEVE